MRQRILNYRVAATHETITVLNSLQDPISISDFDAFVFDPDGVMNQSLTSESLQRKSQELADLVHRKGGIIVCLMRPNDWQVNLAGFGLVHKYWLLEGLMPTRMRNILNNIKNGAGSNVNYVRSAKGPTSAYIQVLRKNLQFSAYVALNEEQVAGYSGVPFATNSVGHVIATEFRIGEGVIALVPIPHDVTGDRLGAAIIQAVNAHFSKQTDIEVPVWAQGIEVPGAQAYQGQIAALVVQRDALSQEISSLESAQSEITSYRRLLFGYGKGVLEPQVRTALRLLGFSVKEPSEYSGEWDIDLTVTETGATAIGEVEGSEGPIDINKSRQLLDYIEAEAVEGRDHKGILIGNGFRLCALDTAERQRQFSDHALRAAQRFQFCLLPTTELFKAVCAVLESPEDGVLKAQIRASLLGCIGPWSFAR